MPEASTTNVAKQLQKAIDSQARVQQAARDAAQGKAPAPKDAQDGKR